MIKIINDDVFVAIKRIYCPIHAIITDPPYSSGGLYASSRSQNTDKKYIKSGMNPNFTGDQKDQRSWTNWQTEWLTEARKLCVPGAVVCMFTDWRQLPSTTDALQWAGFIWRGVIVWNKKNARPQPGRFRNDCEYIVWGSNGDLPTSRAVSVLPGCFIYSPPAARVRKHQTEKPLELMKEIVKICEPGGMILDPFCGSGTTLEAAALMGYDAIGIELDEYYFKVALERLKPEDG